MRDRRANLITTAAIVAVAIVLGLPVLWMAVSAVLPRSVLLDPGYVVIPNFSEVDLSVFLGAATDPQVLNWIGNSLVITVASTIIGLSVSIPAGYSLSRFKVRGQGVMGLGLLLNLMLPGTLLVLPLFVTFSSFHLINNKFAVAAVIAVTVVPFSTWMMKAFFDSVPRSLEEAAALDGCSRATAFFRIVLPISKPAIAAVTAYSVIWSWSDFLFPKTLLTSQDQWPVTVGIVSFIGEYTTNWGGFMATGLLSALPLMIVFFLLEPWLVSGFGAGAVRE